MLYLDTSALVKTVVTEEESAALARALGGAEAADLFSSALSRTELRRAAARRGPEALPAVRRTLSRLTLVALTTDLLDAAGALPPVGLRSLDAIHLATALELGSELDAVVTYDTRMAEAAEHHGLTVLAPGGSGG